MSSIYLEREFRNVVDSPFDKYNLPDELAEGCNAIKSLCTTSITHSTSASAKELRSDFENCTFNVNNIRVQQTTPEGMFHFTT